MTSLRDQFREAIQQASDSPVMDALLDQLVAITEERIADYRDTVHAVLKAAGGSEDLDELERQCNEAGPKPSFFVRKQFEKLREQRDAAWRLAQSLQDVLNGRLDGWTKSIEQIIEDHK